MILATHFDHIKFKQQILIFKAAICRVSNIKISSHYQNLFKFIDQGERSPCIDVVIRNINICGVDKDEIYLLPTITPTIIITTINVSNTVAMITKDVFLLDLTSTLETLQIPVSFILWVSKFNPYTQCSPLPSLQKSIVILRIF